MTSSMYIFLSVIHVDSVIFIAIYSETQSFLSFHASRSLTTTLKQNEFFVDLSNTIGMHDFSDHFII